MSESFDDMEKEIFAAMRQLGWTIPVTNEEVERAEQELENDAITLPDSLRDPNAVFGRIRGPQASEVKPESFTPNNEYEENLARAAREGGKITPEVEEQMKKDREAKEGSR